MPAGYMKFLARDTYLTMHKVVPQPQLGGRRPSCRRPRCWAAAAPVNAMVYIRGQAEDYDSGTRLWAAPAGATRTSCRISSSKKATIISASLTTA